MSIMEKNALDMAAVLMGAYELGDLIIASAEVKDYLYWKNAVEAEPSVQALMKQFARKKELFEQCERFGHYHPDYHAALDEVKKAENELDALPAVKNFKQAEKQLDDLLFSVSKTIARSVSETIKVPNNDPMPSGGCGSGGSCSGNCG
jgi:cell fate (sporulation/competence/biofilm development) regulator YlbF (YheA/YmcA/DUF963 family)